MRPPSNDNEGRRVDKRIVCVLLLEHARLLSFSLVSPQSAAGYIKEGPTRGCLFLTCTCHTSSTRTRHRRPVCVCVCVCVCVWSRGVGLLARLGKSFPHLHLCWVDCQDVCRARSQSRARSPAHAVRRTQSDARAALPHLCRGSSTGESDRERQNCPAAHGQWRPPPAAWRSRTAAPPARSRSWGGRRRPRAATQAPSLRGPGWHRGRGW